MKRLFAALAVAGFFMAGCAVGNTTPDNAPQQSAQKADTDADEVVTGSRLPRKKTSQQ
ncbi:hypothetical protein [Pseudoduganella namucuonensis]|uniref:Lipoprotein n=1 Tax=Pseudoduganella namucuonensis TaxID=1035707 RepID=A0A1I7JN59_9BURK|nr:hypothetical protein [Pseudoduganella namucuonensis]SFU86586.1 hypothetical protein SAMN05216552_101277 [Pseudoduganella namucuonensis]